MEAREFGKYVLLEGVGKGGVGTVYRARSSETGEIVAVKVFQCTAERPVDYTRRLRDREVRMLLSVQHPNIVQFRETGEVGSDHYYTMEFVERSLLERMRGGGDFKLVDKVHLLRQVASALAAVHRQGIVHRDVKPGNILLSVEPGGAVHAKLTDLGIAINVSESDIIQEQRRGAIPGTPKYLSPEQIHREHLDGRADIFSLGVVAYELLTAQLPFQADKPDDYMVANIEQTPVPPAQLVEGFPAFLSEMVEHMLVKDREERYDSDTLARDLQLVEQHLVSGAPLIERTNATSLFYQAEEAGPSRRGLPRIAPVSYVLALGLVLAGGATGWFAWPGRAQASQPVALPLSDNGPDVLLQEARAAIAAGQNYRARLALSSIDPASLSEEQEQAFQDLSRTVQEALAAEAYSTASRMLHEQRQAEAEVVLMRMKDDYADSDWTRRLDGDLTALRQRATNAQRWDRALAHTYDLVRRRLYSDALAERRKLLQDFGDDPARAQQARRAIADLLQSWGAYLQQTNPGIDRIEEFLAAQEENAPAGPGQPADPVVGALRLRLAQRYQAASDFARALEEYELAAEQGDSITAARARSAYDRLHERMLEMPVEAAAFVKEVADEGLGGASWRTHADPRGRQSIAAGVLSMQVAAGEGPCVVERQTARPVRNLGFDVAVQFRVGRQPAAGQPAARAGLGVTDSRGTSYELFFDGAGYGLSRRVRGSALSSTLRGPVGDEATAWHTLRLRYVFDTGRLSTMLDDQALDEQSVNLSDLRVSLFLDTQAAGAAAVDFRSFTYAP